MVGLKRFKHVWAITSPEHDTMTSKGKHAAWLAAPPCTGWGPCEREAAVWFCKLEPKMPAPPPTPPPTRMPPPKPATPTPPPGPAPKRARAAHASQHLMPAQPNVKTQPVKTEPEEELLLPAFDGWLGASDGCGEPRADVHS